MFVVELQVQSTLAKVDDLLVQAGTDKSKLLSANIWLKSMEDFGTYLSPVAIIKSTIAPSCQYQSLVMTHSMSLRSSNGLVFYGSMLCTDPKLIYRSDEQNLDRLVRAGKQTRAGLRGGPDGSRMNTCPA